MSNERVYYDPRFSGTDNLWKNPSGLTYTDSVQDFCEKNGAYWVLDVIASYLPTLQLYPFLLICFNVEDQHCSFHCKEDSNEPDVVYQYIEFTDLKVNLRLYLCSGVLMFPTDY